LGFNLTKEEAIADPGWFFVIQQQPTEPSFGLDVANFAKPPPPPEPPPLTRWDDLSWRHLANTEEDLQALSHVSIEKPALATPPGEKATWGRNAAHQAYITLQRAVRIAMHATIFLLSEDVTHGRSQP
jgi:hypothetical protein